MIAQTSEATSDTAFLSGPATGLAVVLLALVVLLVVLAQVRATSRLARRTDVRCHVRPIAPPYDQDKEDPDGLPPAPRL